MMTEKPDPIERLDDGTIVATGAGVEVYRIAAWKSAARLAQKGIKANRLATVAAFRKQFGSGARTWAQVEVECETILAAYEAQMGGDR